MKLKTERDLSYIDPLTVESFQNNGTSSISITLLTKGRKDRWTNSREFNTSLVEVKILNSFTVYTVGQNQFSTTICGLANSDILKYKICVLGPMK